MKTYSPGSILMENLIKKYPSIPFVAPFAAFIALMGLRSNLSLDPKWEYAARVVVVSAVLLLVSGGVGWWRPKRPLVSAAVGVLVFGVWVLPDVIWPSYRHHWLFQNVVTGKAMSSLPAALQTDALFLGFRLVGTAVVVPIVEELFWRGWLMRFMIDSDFTKVPLGTYSSMSFFFTAALFAAEHGPFWDVGLIAGIIYNWWILRNGNLADCMIAHAITNLCLAMFVVFGGHWQYWL